MRCLEACARLRFPRERFEVIVVDDGGQLDPSIVDAFGDRMQVTLATQPRRGPAAARNAGVRIARREYLAFTDDDCEPAPDWLDRIATHLERQPAAAIGGRTINALPGNVYSATSQLLVDYLYEYYAGRTDGARFFTTNNLVIRRDTFVELGGFLEYFTQAAAEDRELCFRAARRGVPLLYADDAIVHHWHDLSLPTFCRQHFRYGKGAARMHRVVRGAFEDAFRVEPAAFYARLLLSPLRFETVPRRMYGIGLSALTQVAHALGYFVESLRLRRERPESRAPGSDARGDGVLRRPVGIGERGGMK
jgi:cellulose synthase/poly-beta-1,6-N-acetylglucosamine synthase-like glycosyltransferase